MTKKKHETKYCGCGSNKIYNECCGIREWNDETFKLLIAERFNSGFSKNECFVPCALKSECEGKIIRAHTVSKSSSLKTIADDSHVLCYTKPDLFNMTREKPPTIALRREGINKASTFTGFCCYHDKALFSCVEDQIFTGTKEQVFALLYRSLAFEKFKKIQQYKSAKANIFCKGELHKRRTDEFFINNTKQNLLFSGTISWEEAARIIDNQVLFDSVMQQQKVRFLYEEKKLIKLLNININSILEGLKDFDKLFEHLNHSLENKAYNGYSGKLMKFNMPLPVLCSGVVAPEVLINGDRLQDFHNFETRMHLLSVNAFSDGGFGYILFSWSDTNTKCKQYIDDFIAQASPNGLLPSVAISFLLNQFEGVCISPVWYNSLEIVDKKRIELLINNLVDFFTLNSPCISTSSLQNYSLLNITDV